MSLSSEGPKVLCGLLCFGFECSPQCSTMQPTCFKVLVTSLRLTCPLSWSHYVIHVPDNPVLLALLAQ